MKERWKPEQHKLDYVLDSLNVGETIDCQGLTVAETKEVAYASFSKLTWQGKRFVSLKTEIGQAVRRIT